MDTVKASASPDPDWTVVRMASDAVKAIQWCIAGNHVSEEDMETALAELKEVIETEVAKL